MTADRFVLAGAIALGLLFWSFAFWHTESSWTRLVVKTGSTLLLAVFAWMVGGPKLLVAALALSAAGDAFLELDGANWLKPGMAAFFLGHVAYVVLFWGLPHSARGWLVPVLQVALVVGGFLYVRWLAPSLGDMRIPVFAYSAIILLMGAMALRLDTAYLLVTVGALMFVASDMILATQLFGRPAGSPPNLAASLAVWGLYFFGQALIAWGGVRPLAAAGRALAP